MAKLDNSHTRKHKKGKPISTKSRGYLHCERPITELDENLELEEYLSGEDYRNDLKLFEGEQL